MATTMRVPTFTLPLAEGDGYREEELYCWATLQSRAIVREDLLHGALGTDVGFDGLHLDGVSAAVRCADRDHAHRAGVSNEQVAGLREQLTLLQREIPDLVLDQEIPLECLMDVFDSAAGEAFPAADAPPLYRMIYGRLNRYSQPIILFGENPQWGDHTLFDLKRLLPLKDGVLPVLVFLDTPGTFTANQDADEPVKRLLRSYILNYERLLRPAFEGDVVRMPKIEAPACGVFALRVVPFPGGPGELIVSRTDPVVQGTAFAWNENGRRKAAIVLMDWGTRYGVSSIGVGRRFYRRDPHLPEEGIQIGVDAHAPIFRESHSCRMAIRARDLTLSSDGMYVAALFRLNANSLRPYDQAILGRFGPDFSVTFTMAEASLAVVVIEQE